MLILFYLYVTVALFFLYASVQYYSLLATEFEPAFEKYPNIHKDAKSLMIFGCLFVMSVLWIACVFIALLKK